MSIIKGFARSEIVRRAAIAVVAGSIATLAIVVTPTVASAKTTAPCGVASWYGGKWIGRLTANGERYNPKTMTAAHPSLPFGTRVRVTRQSTGKSVIVRINNRGPYAKGRIIDLSIKAAENLGFYGAGVTKVCVARVG